MDSYNARNIEKETLLIVVTSTFGDGDAPDNGISFENYLQTYHKMPRADQDVPTK